MPSLRLFVSEDTKAKLEAAAPSYGGRAAMLRLLISKAAEAIDPLPPPKGRPLRTFVRLSAAETEALAAHAASRGLRVSTWICTLVRRRLFGEPRFLRSEELALYAILDRLQDIARDLGRLERRALAEPDLSQLQSLLGLTRQEVRAAMQGLKAAVLGNLTYWDLDDEPSHADRL